jgi:uncharacterized alkaline shock family protein YloU
MSTETQGSQSQSQSSGGSQLAKRDQSSGGGELQSEHGTTTIADSVVAKVAGIAAREVAGVYDMGAASSRALGKVTSQVGLRDERTQGVSVEVGQREAAADLTVVIEYGESIARVSQEVRDNVIRRIEGVCGLDVTEVNIAVTDLHFPGDDREETPQEPARVE